MSILSRFKKPSIAESVVASAADSGIFHPGDFFLHAPKRFRAIDERGRFSRFLAFTGFGRSKRYRFQLGDTNGDGVCVLSVSTGDGIETNVYNVNGKRVFSVHAGETGVINHELPAGPYSVVWKEV